MATWETPNWDQLPEGGWWQAVCGPDVIKELDFVRDNDSGNLTWRDRRILYLKYAFRRTTQDEFELFFFNGLRAETYTQTMKEK